MTTIPVELTDARLAATEAWNEYNQLLEHAHTRQQYDEALQKAHNAEIASADWYRRWQAVGGTSDIRSIVEAEKFIECVETCLTDPAHINKAVSVAELVTNNLQPKRMVTLDWQREAEAQAADFTDLKRTEEDARF